MRCSLLTSSFWSAATVALVYATGACSSDGDAAAAPDAGKPRTEMTASPSVDPDGAAPAADAMAEGGAVGVDAGAADPAREDASVAADAGLPRHPVDAGATTYPACVNLPSSIPAGTSDKIDPAVRPRENADVGQLLVVQLRGDLTPALPNCPAGQTTCAERDQAALERMRLHQQQVACVIDVAGSQSGRLWWYDAPVLLSTGDPTARLLGLGVVMLGRDVETVASHPFVAGISLPPDLVPATDECPMAVAADVRSKVDATGASPTGRSFAIVTVNRPFECGNCQDIRVQRHTHIASTRSLTCLFQHIKRITREFELLPHAGGDATIGQPDTAFQREFAVPLTEQEALEVARDPYVQRISLTNAPITSPTKPMDQLNEGPCPEANDAIAGKIEHEELLRPPGPHTCIIGVKGGGDARSLDVLCPPGGPCPEREAAYDRLMVAHRQSQRCVREFLDGLGADFSDEVLFGNAFVARLTFDQVMRLAAHPHVLSITADVVTVPP
jgi:hypothetical protein